MPDESPLRPRVLRGELQVHQSQDASSRPIVIPFQYNPENVRRSLASRAPASPQSSHPGNAREEVLRVAGPPVETINVTIVLDAADLLGDPNPDERVVADGLYPVLATLELLMYPSSDKVAEDRQRAQRGETQGVPMETPLVVLVFGPRRAAPVLVTSFSITEDEFDPRLNPIRAHVELALRVLSYKELPPTSLGVQLYDAYQREKERLAYPPGEPNAAGRVAGVRA